MERWDDSRAGGERPKACPAPVGVPILADPSFRHALPEGCRVICARGEVLVETLGADDRIVTRDRGMVRIRAMVRVLVARGTPMVLIPAGAMGRGRPGRDVLLPPQQPVVLRDWRARTVFGAREARVVAARLIDGKVIRSVPSPGGFVWSVVLDRPSAIYVDGLELVSGATGAVGS